MAGLVCDICGGKLIMADHRQSSQCENCCVEYSINVMRDMVAALEGAELNVKGIATAQSLIDYAYSFMETDVAEAEKQFKEALKIDAQNSRAWKGLFDCEIESQKVYYRTRYWEFENIEVDGKNLLLSFFDESTSTFSLNLTIIKGFIKYKVKCTLPKEKHLKYEPSGFSYMPSTFRMSETETGKMECFYYNGYYKDKSHENYVGDGKDAHLFIKNAIKCATSQQEEDEYKLLEEKCFLFEPELMKKALLFFMSNFFAVKTKNNDDYKILDSQSYADYRKKSEKEEQERLSNLGKQWTQQGLCRYCGGQMGGMFTKKCKQCGEVN